MAVVNDYYYEDYTIMQDDDFTIQDDDFTIPDDDFIMCDADDSVCDDERDGLSLEEVCEYENELKLMSAFRERMVKVFGLRGYGKWKKIAEYQY